MAVDIAVEFSTEESIESSEISPTSGDHDNFKIELSVSDVNQGQSSSPIPSASEQYHVTYELHEENKLHQGKA